MTVYLEAEFSADFEFLLDPPLGKVRHRVAFGGRGSAKSWHFARALLIKGAEAPLRILCLREFQTSIRESVHQVLADQVALMGLTDCYDVQEQTLLGRNGTEFIFRGLHRNLNGIRSLEGVDVSWLEEGQAASEESLRVLEPTIRKLGSELWTSFNPDQVSDPVYQRYIVHPPPSAIIRETHYSRNPWLTDVLREQAEHMRRTDPEGYANVWDGKVWTRSDTQVLNGKWRVEPFEVQPHWDGPYRGADWGFSTDPAVAIECWIADNVLYLAQEEGGVGLDLDQLEAAFRALSDPTAHRIWGDNARPETINELRKRGLPVEAADKWPGSVEDGITHLRSYEAIVIHPRCPRAIQEARLYRYRVHPKTGEVLRKLVDANNHVWDAVRYALGGFIRRRGTQQPWWPGKDDRSGGVAHDATGATQSAPT